MQTSIDFHSRTVERTVRGQATSDGDGVRLTRVLTQPMQQRLDPFLMLDAFGSDSADDYVGGFPEHPHRGFETVTIMKAGRMRHRDSAGNVGLLEPGSVQWMTAGRGIVHSEMPEQAQGRMAGFQLWVNLAAADKLQPPAYRDVPPSDVPTVLLPDGVAVRVIAGAFGGTDGAVQRPRTAPLVLDIVLPPGAVLDVPIPVGHNAFAYVYRDDCDPAGDAAAQIGGSDVASGRMAILSGDSGDGSDGSDGVDSDSAARGVRLAASARTAVQVLLVAGKPLGEPIAQHGPFVMNTPQELQQAVRDFQRGVLTAG